ncbi:MAG: PQQ-binding-like beta-propeller repeat protein [Verrucomicrobiota bacterium]
MKIFHLSLCLILTTGLAKTHAENWPEFRGPSGQGHSSAENLPTEWNQSKNVAWKKSIDGKGWSSPVLVDNRLFLTTAVDDNPGSNNTDRSLRALCLDANSGEEIWNVEVFEQDADDAYKIHKKNSHASPTPLYENERLYVHFGHDGTACLDARTGKVLWKQDNLRFPPVHGNGGCPIIAGDHLIFSCDGGKAPFIAALNKNNGRVAWKTARNVKVDRPFSFATPLLIKVNGQDQVISPASGAVMAYDPKTGKEIWRCRYGQGYSVVPRPVFAHDLVFVCSGFNRANLLAIRPDGTGDITDSHIAWTAEKGVPKNASPIVVGDYLYMVDDSGVASCLEAKTGKVSWQERLRGNFSASPLFADGKLYFLSEEGTTYVVDAKPKFRLIAENKLNEPALASITPADNTLFIRTEENLYRIEG